MTKIKRPSQKLVFTEVSAGAKIQFYGSNIASFWWNMETGTNDEEYLTYRHGGGNTINVTWFDGHVSNVHYSRMDWKKRNGFPMESGISISPTTTFNGKSCVRSFL